jgi:hypothetical protein
MRDVQLGAGEMHPTLPSHRIGLAALAVLGLLVVGAGPGQAGNDFRAGGRSTRSTPAGNDAVARAQARGRAVAAALGLPGVSQRVERLDDLFEHRTYDEVTSLDAAGREVAITRLEPDGAVAMALSLGWHPSSGPAIDAPAAAVRAEALARAIGLAPVGRPAVRASAGAGGWSIAWPRTVDGVVVRGDGLRIALWLDGTFHGLTRSERQLAPAPAADRRIGSAAARAAAAAVVRAPSGSSAGDLQVGQVERVWVAPNDTFGGSRIDAPAEILRLAWAVRFDATGALSERVRSVEVWIDAGDGHLLGGDVVE